MHGVLDAVQFRSNKFHSFVGPANATSVGRRRLYSILNDFFLFMKQFQGFENGVYLFALSEDHDNYDDDDDDDRMRNIHEM